MCDVHSTFQHANLPKGVCPLLGFSQTLLSTIGDGVAASFYLTNEGLAAGDAMQLGLVDEVCFGVSTCHRQALSVARHAHVLRPVTIPSTELLASEASRHAECILANEGRSWLQSTDDAAACTFAGREQLLVPMLGPSRADSEGHADGLRYVREVRSIAPSFELPNCLAPLPNCVLVCCTRGMPSSFRISGASNVLFHHDVVASEGHSPALRADLVGGAEELEAESQRLLVAWTAKLGSSVTPVLVRTAHRRQAARTPLRASWRVRRPSG